MLAKLDIFAEPSQVRDLLRQALDDELALVEALSSVRYSQTPMNLARELVQNLAGNVHAGGEHITQFLTELKRQAPLRADEQEIVDESIASAQARVRGAQSTHQEPEPENVAHKAFKILMRHSPMPQRAQIERMAADYGAFFGGRKQSIKSLDRAIGEPPSRTILLAPAGRGKSSLLFNWTSRLQQDGRKHVVFFSISRRYQTATGLAVLGSLAAQLSAVYGDRTPNYDHYSVEHLQHEVARYLALTPPDGRGLVLVLDGLDEADGWMPRPVLFPNRLSPRVSVVVSARETAHTTDRDLIHRLGWDGTDASVLALNPLSKDEMVSILRNSDPPLADLLKHRRLVESLQSVSQGDPLTVRKIVEGIRDGFFKPERLPTMREGLEAVMKEWILESALDQDQFAPSRDLLLLCAAALGPLETADVQSLKIRGLESAADILAAVNHVKRHVIGNGTSDRGYVLSHPALSDCLLSPTSGLTTVEERRKLVRRFVAYGQDSVRSGRVPRYVRKFWVKHLAAAGLWDYAAGVVTKIDAKKGWSCQPWLQLRLASDDGPSGYLEDLGIVASRAVQTNDLVGRVRCSLLATSISRQSKAITPALLEQLVKYGTPSGRWDPAAALDNIRGIDDCRRRRDALQYLLEAEIGHGLLAWKIALDLDELPHPEHYSILSLATRGLDADARRRALIICSGIVDPLTRLLSRAAFELPSHDVSSEARKAGMEQELAWLTDGYRTAEAESTHPAPVDRARPLPTEALLDRAIFESELLRAFNDNNISSASCASTIEEVASLLYAPEECLSPAVVARIVSAAEVVRGSGAVLILAVAARRVHGKRRRQLAKMALANMKAAPATLRTHVIAAYLPVMTPDDVKLVASEAIWAQSHSILKKLEKMFPSKKPMLVRMSAMRAAERPSWLRIAGAELVKEAPPDLVDPIREALSKLALGPDLVELWLAMSERLPVVDRPEAVATALQAASSFMDSGPAETWIACTQGRRPKRTVEFKVDDSMDFEEETTRMARFAESSQESRFLYDVEGLKSSVNKVAAISDYPGPLSEEGFRFAFSMLGAIPEEECRAFGYAVLTTHCQGEQRRQLVELVLGLLSVRSAETSPERLLGPRVAALSLVSGYLPADERRRCVGACVRFLRSGLPNDYFGIRCIEALAPLVQEEEVDELIRFANRMDMLYSTGEAMLKLLPRMTRHQASKVLVKSIGQPYPRFEVVDGLIEEFDNGRVGRDFLLYVATSVVDEFKWMSRALQFELLAAIEPMLQRLHGSRALGELAAYTEAVRRSFP